MWRFHRALRLGDFISSFISIHQMWRFHYISSDISFMVALYFNTSNVTVPPELSELTGISQSNFNTSNVTVPRLAVMSWPFPCLHFNTSNVTVPPRRSFVGDPLYSKFQYIKCDGSTREILPGVLHPVQFQYIKCDGSTICSRDICMALIYFNTSNVTVPLSP